MSATFDLLFAGATVVDGTGAARFVADVGVRGDRIALLGPAPEDVAAGRVVNCAGLCLAPGFIDVHTHDDHLPFVDPAMGSVLRQGVTSVVVGNCGDSLWPPSEAASLGPYLADLEPGFGRSWGRFGEYLEAVDACHPGANIAGLVGHGSVRDHVLGESRREAGTADVRAMRDLVGAERGGLYTSHIRGEGPTLFRAVREALDVSRRAGVPAHISHLKLAAEDVWHRAAELLDLVHQGGASGDQYPYTAGLTDLVSLLPPWATTRPFAALRADPATLARLGIAIQAGEPDWVGAAQGVSWDHLAPVVTTRAGTEGRSLAELARERGETPVETMLAILEDDADALVLIHGMLEEDVRAILADPEVMIASDSFPAPDDARWSELRDHPRSYGTFPRVLGHYVRDEALLPLEAAIRKMTGLPAERFGLRGRGVVAEGANADLTLFAPDTVSGGSDFTRPHAAPEDIRLVVVNGRVAWEGGVRERAGRVLRRAS